jgi:transcriptional regulator with XRE-family HTH domain
MTHMPSSQLVRKTNTPLRQWRVGQGLTLRAAARKGRCNPGWLSRVERGGRRPRPAQVARLVRDLGVPVEVILASIPAEEAS